MTRMSIFFLYIYPINCITVKSYKTKNKNIECLKKFDLEVKNSMFTDYATVLINSKLNNFEETMCTCALLYNTETMKQQASTCTMMLYQVILADTQNNS
jgi:hypothetical protein